MNEEMLKQIMEDETLTAEQKELAQIVLGDAADSEHKLAVNAMHTIEEIMAHISAIQELVDKNTLALRVANVAIIISMSMMGAVDIENPEPQLNEKCDNQGVRIARTIVGPKTCVKALMTDLVTAIRDKEVKDE